MLFIGSNNLNIYIKSCFQFVFLLFFTSGLISQTIDTLKIKSEADSLLTVARSFQKSSRLEDALDLYQNSLGKFREIGDRGGEAMSLKMIGVVKFYQGKAQEIFPYWEKELSIHQNFPA